MPMTLETVVAKYLRSGNPAQRTREEYSTTLRKWARWGAGLPFEQLGRRDIREFLDWVYEDAAAQQGRTRCRSGRSAGDRRTMAPGMVLLHAQVMSGSGVGGAYGILTSDLIAYPSPGPLPVSPWAT